MRRTWIIALLLAATTAGAQKAGYHVVKRIEIGGEGGWDYLLADHDAHRLYLSRGTHVMVLDTDRDSVIADIPNTPGVHGVALAHALGKGFTSNGRDSTVSVFDLATLRVTARVNVGARNPDAIFYDSTTERVFTFNGGSANATAIDARSGAVVGMVPLGGKPEAAVSDGRRILVNIEDKAEIVAFDPRTLGVLARWSIAPCEDPTGLALDRESARLFAVCGNRLMMVVDAASGRVVTTVPIGAGSDGAAFDPATHLAFSTNGGDGTVTVVRQDGRDRPDGARGAHHLARPCLTPRVHGDGAVRRGARAARGESPAAPTDAAGVLHGHRA